MPASPFESVLHRSPSHRLGLRYLITVLVAAAAAVGVAAATSRFFFALAAAPPAQVVLAGYATSMEGRSPSQRHNARLSVQELDGAAVPPGGFFSFNSRVKSWSMDRGYVKAPVSFDGDLIRAFGGGVCQTSTTLYNAALLAGLPIVERHAHSFVAHYAPPGQDAAVAHPSIDLRFKNPYPWPIHIRASARNGRLEVKILGARRPEERFDVTTEILSTTTPKRLTRLSDADTGRAYVRSPGAAGCRVVAYRTTSKGGRVLRRERLSDNTYQAMNRIIQVEGS
jgi:vancomycin resistance protein VanW